MMAPITYRPGFIADPDAAFTTLWNELGWVRHGMVPRREYYANDVDSSYSYGKVEFAREYPPQPWHPLMRDIQAAVEAELGARMEVCFLNGYEHNRDQLGWHADDSPEMDDARPIAIVTLGAERDIMFATKPERENVERLKLQHGSLCIMSAGMQDTHVHRIPKADRVVGPRISLTFRGYVDPKAGAVTTAVDAEMAS